MSLVGTGVLARMSYNELQSVSVLKKMRERRIVPKGGTYGIGRTLTVCQEILRTRFSVAQQAYFPVTNQYRLINTARPILAGILRFFASLAFPARSGIIWVEMNETECECEYGY
jgi:hypothetical protein